MSLKIETEIKTESDPCIVTWDGKLFVGTEDGSMKTFDENLSPDKSWSAHGAQIFALAVGGGLVYTSSNDGGVKIWSQDGEKIDELPASEGDIGVLRLYGKELFVGDEVGNIIVYEDNKIKARYNVLEEVKDLAINLPYIFTGRDQYVTVTEIKPDESKTRFMTRHSFEGRAPMQLYGDRLFVAARGGNNLLIHDATTQTNFKKLNEVKASGMMITSLSVCEDYAWTGSWDGQVKRWKIANDQLEPAGEIDLESCINGIAATSKDNAYVAVTGGRVVRVKAV